MVITLQQIIDTVLSVNENANIEIIKKAYALAESQHSGQKRLSGEPYLSHPLAVALTLAQMRCDEASIVAGLLHDVAEDTNFDVEQIDAEFGEEVADIVDGVTKISQMPFDNKEERQAENIRKMILAMAHDIRVLVVKLADRLHNMRTLDFKKTHRQHAIAQETMDIYAPLANRLGLHLMKLELEDLSFKYLHPDMYEQITQWIEKSHATEREVIDMGIERIHLILAANSVKADVVGRIKHKYSIYKKMVAQGLTLDEMHDIIAFRVLVDDVKDCYAVLGLMHSQWKPVHGRFKDYISMPKGNGYQSLHTTVIGPNAERVEIQIRTHEMHKLAEHGVASHWLYKEHGRINPKDLAQFTWLREIFDRQSMESDSHEFMQSLRLDLFKDEVYVFTPKGAVKALPEGATPVDFAYFIHTQIGDKCTGAKVNGKIVPLSTRLRSSDVVEIITDPNRKPSRDWLKFVKTAKARTRVQNYIRTEERERAVSLGKEMLEKEGRRVGLNLAKKIKDGSLLLLLEEFSLNSLTDLYAAIGYARFTPRKVLHRFLAKNPGIAEKEAKPATPSAPETAAEAKNKKMLDAVCINNVDNVLIRFAKCCNPVPGDSIVGYISRGRGVTVHTSDCSTIATMEPERLLPVYWDGDEDKPFPVRILTTVQNKKGVLATVAGILEREDVDITSGNIRSLVDGKAEMEFTILVKNTAELYKVLNSLRRLDTVYEVSRFKGD